MQNCRFCNGQGHHCNADLTHDCWYPCHFEQLPCGVQEGAPSSRGLDSSDELVKAISTKQTSHAAPGDFVDSDSFIVANPRSLLELDKAPRSIPISETGSVPSALSLGSTPGSFRSSESDPATWTLPTLPWRDWELNLDDLRVCSN